MGKKYNEVVEFKGKTADLNAITRKINNSKSFEFVRKVIQIVLESNKQISEKNVFCEAALILLKEKIGDKAVRDIENQKQISDYYDYNKNVLFEYSRIYDQNIAILFASPAFGFFEKEGGEKIYHHVTASYSFESEKEEMKRLMRPYNRYAAMGCINTMRFLLDGDEVEYLSPVESDIIDKTYSSGMVRDFARETITKNLGEILNYFFDDFTFIKKDKYRKEIMQEIKRLCDESQQSRVFFLGYYESRPELFDELFAEFPEYIFITQGKYKRYEVIMDLAEKLEITMQDKPEIEAFFADKPESNRTDDETDEKAAFIRGRYAFGMEEHQIKLIHALDSFTQRLLGEGQDYQIYNFWPNDTLDRRVVKPVGPYIAVAFKRHDKWYMLIDGIYERCAIYIWTGENLIDGLSIFKTNKGYARQQQNVCHLNHRGTREAYEITYLKALSKIS